MGVLDLKSQESALQSQFAGESESSAVQTPDAKMRARMVELQSERERLLLPKRAITVSCPIHRDDASIAVFEGYRVQHHLPLGPPKGATRFAPSVDIGEVAAVALWMRWTCALVGLP